MQPENNPAEVVRGVCADCPFYDHLGGQSQGETVAPEMAGICRKGYPRHVQELEAAKVPDTLISGIRPGIWPIVRGNDWCGYHPVRTAAYQLGIEEMREAIKARQKDAMRAARRAGSSAPANPPSGGTSGSRR